ncbi:hypothetical protein L3V83_11395 [Thiotrichales bacterium 19X7-9]|nr:hypothetical protein [Thiotrichales bacterium 19X7-9]
MKIRRAMRTLGYHPNEKGVCYGISYMGTQALLRGDFATFKKRIELIHSLKSRRHLKGSIQRAERKRKLNKPLTEKDNLWLLIKPFFDGISVYQNSFNDDDETVMQNIHPMFSRQDYHVGNKLFNGGFYEGVYTSAMGLKIFNQQNLVEFLTSNESIVLEAVGEPAPSRDGYDRIGGEKKDVLVYNLFNEDHVITIAFDKKQWHFIDHDTVWSGTDKNILSQKIMSALGNNYSSHIVITFEENTSKQVDHKSLHIMHPPISIIENETCISQLLSRALRRGWQHIAERYLTDIIEKYGDKESFHYAIGSESYAVDFFFEKMLTTGNHNLIKHYCDKVNDFDGFTYEDQKTIFNPELQSQRNKGIYNAISRNNHQALKTYFDSIRLSWLPHKDKCTQILSHLSDPDTTRLFNESKVKKETMEVYVETLIRLKLGEVERSKLPETLRDALPPILVKVKNPDYGTTQPPKIFDFAPKAEEIDRSAYYL